MTNDLHATKEFMMDMAELGAAIYAKSVHPKSDEMTQNEAFAKFGQGWVRSCVKRELIRGYRKGPAKNSPIYFSKADLTGVLKAEKASRLGVFDNTKI